MQTRGRLDVKQHSARPGTKRKREDSMESKPFSPLTSSPASLTREVCGPRKFSILLWRALPCC